MEQGESILTSLESLKALKQQRYNPLRGMSAGRLASMLDAFELGELSPCALLWEQIAERDDTIKSVKPKREKSVSGLEVVYQPKPGSGAAGAAQADAMRNFWSRVRATNAYDRNVSGGLRMLIQQMMTAVSYRYAAHHIVWSPRASGLEATFEMVPLWLFENKTGKLRYLKNPYDLNGIDMPASEWLVTSGEGLMISCSIGWLAKRETYNDWLIFSKNFAIPGVLGRTKAAKDSPEGRAMRAAVIAFGQEMKGVVYNDDGSIEKPIEIIQADGSPNGMPMPSIIERVDRKIATLYRGNDLSTMSHTGSGKGSGASLQAHESEILLDDDISLIEEQLASVSQMVLEWIYGAGVEICAEVKLLTKEQAAARAGTVEVKSPSGAMQEQANALGVPTDENPTAEVGWMNALGADMRPLCDALNGAMQAGDGPAVKAALKKISNDLPDYLETPELEALLESDFVKALTGEGKEAVENAARRNEQRKWVAGTANQRGGKYAADNWQGNGLPPASEIPAEPSSGKIPAASAEKRLNQGEAVLSDGGEVVGFTRAILDHWRNDDPAIQPQEERRRLMELEDAQDAVRNPHEVWETSGRLGRQKAYLRKFKGQGAERWMAVFVPEGTGRSYYSSAAPDKADSSFRKGKLVRDRTRKIS